jgi:hypothetical protein
VSVLLLSSSFSLTHYYIYSQANAKCDNIPAVTQLRVLRNEYQRGYEKNLKSQNWVELREGDRFLHYEEIQQVLKSLMDEFLEGQKDPKRVKDTTESPLLLKAKQLQRFLILLFYTSLPPSRALEMRTLQHGTSLTFKKATNTWWLTLSEFKTVKNKGVDSVELNPTSQKVLVTYLELFLSEYRPLLMEHWWMKKMKTNPMVRREHVVDEKYLFVPPGNTKHQGYAESAWSAMVCNLFKEKAGMAISINNLRSSFITYFYDSEASSNLNLRESIANGMRHSISEAQRTYDRRYFLISILLPLATPHYPCYPCYPCYPSLPLLPLTALHYPHSTLATSPPSTYSALSLLTLSLSRTSFEKKRKAVDWCGTNTMKWLEGGEGESTLPPPPKVIKKGPTAEKKYDDNEPHCHAPNLGDVVAVPFVDGESDESSFWLGKCLRVNNEDSTLLLGWFQEIGEGKYKMKIGASWPEVRYLFLPLLFLSSHSLPILSLLLPVSHFFLSHSFSISEHQGMHFPY